MSDDKRKRPGRGWMFAACFGVTCGVVAVADEPGTPLGPSAPAPARVREQFLLLTDGRLIRGVISWDGETYLVKQKVGTIPCPARKVERAFDSVEEAYRYRLERVPKDDPSERLRLARWCMSWNLNKEARMLLEQVLEISPNHGPAKAMLTKMDQSEATRVARAEAKVDEGVRQTSGEAIAEDRPGALDWQVLRGAERRMGITGLPVIFDLPQAMAVQRAAQFKQYVHPVLQAYCVKCHGPEYDGPFQLVPVRSARERTPDALRTNLDATLRLIDQDNPARSELLSSTLRPHGNSGKRRPIFSGSNDRAYQILATWATSLRPQPVAEPGARAGGLAPAEPDEAFAVDRDRRGGDAFDEFARGGRGGDSRRAQAAKGPAAQGPVVRSFRYVEGQGRVPEESPQADPGEFPLPYMLGGPRPAVPDRVGARDAGRTPPPATRGAAEPNAGRATRAERPGDAPSADDVADPAVSGSSKPRPGTAAKEPATPKKSVKLDPKLLERLLQRNANRQDGN